MRMLSYFGVFAAVVIPALLATAALGIFGQPELHLKVGLLAAILAVGLHSLLIIFMIVTGRLLKEAMASRDLSPEFLSELNEFFAKKAAYPAAVFGATFIVFAGVLGYGAPALGLSPAVHMLAGLAALVFNLWAIPIEVRALRANQDLLDRAALELDAIDERTTASERAVVDDAEMIDPRHFARGGLIFAVSSWMPYLYWALIVWRGDFSKVSVHPWLEASLAGLFVWFLARREMAIPRSLGRSE